MLRNIFLPNLETDKDKNRKNVATDFCYFNENYFYNRNLLKVDNISDKKVSNNKNEEEFRPALEKA